MGLFILQETPVGYALLKARSSKILSDNDFSSKDASAEEICNLLKLKDFHKFDSAATALEQTAALVEAKVTPRLTTLLDSLKDEKKSSLAVADPKLAGAINKLPGLDLKLISDATTEGLYRSIRDHLPSLIPGLLPQDISTMSLGLSHSLSRHKLKFSPDKVDTMIVQAISLLDDLDKELNTYSMRVKEWYGWHFPEMGRIVNDNFLYARTILRMGMRSSATKADFEDILPEDMGIAVKAAAEVSMGTEITAEDLENIQALAAQVVDFTEYRSQLSSYLTARMEAIAPNLTQLVGDLVGARLIAHAGSLMNLAKSPASTIQILGAEKALFRALKTKHDTPKYGLIYHASLIGQATGKNKGKMARMLATKAALGLRVDALADWSAEGEGKGEAATEEERSLMGHIGREKLERRLQSLEGRPLRSKGVAIAPNGVSSQPAKFDIKEARKYNHDADGLAGQELPAADSNKSKKGKKEKKLIEEVSEEPALKKAKVDKLDAIEPIEKVVKAAIEEDLDDLSMGEESGEESSDIDMEERPEAEVEQDIAATNVRSTLKQAKVTRKDANGDDVSETISTISEDTSDSAPSPTQQEINWQSKIEGNTKVAKKARKKERHARRLALSEERSAKRQKERARLARKLDRKERRQKRAEQIERREERDEAKFSDAAKAAGLSTKRYKRKLDRGEIQFGTDGKPVAISKKEMKKARKEAEKAVELGEDGSSKKKRKRVSETNDSLGKSEKKKKKSNGSGA